MTESLRIISRVAMLVFVLSSMVEVGLGLTPRQIFAPLRNARLVVAALAVNFVVVPMAAIGIAKLFHLDEPFAIGLLLIGLAPGAPFLPKLVELARGDLALAVGLMALLMIGTMVFLPVALPRLLPGATVGVWDIARPLVFLMFLPLLAGLALKSRSESLAARLQPSMGRATNISMLIVIGLVVALNLSSLSKMFATGALAAALVFTVVAGLAGYLVGGKDAGTRKTMAIGTGVRNFAAALVIGEEDFQDPRVMLMLVSAALLGLILCLPAALAWGKHSAVTQPDLRG